MAETILQMEQITKAFPGVLALDEVDFELYPGEVHVLLGENGAGKSTLIKVISGLYPRDSGRVFVSGSPVDIGSVRDAQGLGIATIYQELNLAPNLTVAQNIFLGKEPLKRSGGVVIDKSVLRARTAEILSWLNQDIDPDALAGDLPAPHQQMVAIAKALSMDAKIIIFDEPTAVLAEQETAALFKIIETLKERGLGIIYISHRLEEIFRIGDRVTVLRDGKKVDTLKIEETCTDELIRMMVGRELADRYPRHFNQPGEIALELTGVGRGRVPRDIDMTVRQGEIVGIAGLVGSGRTEVARLMFGIDQPTSGEIKIFGESVNVRSPSEAIELGIALVPEERRQQGLFRKLSVGDNIIIAAIRKLFPKAIVRDKKSTDMANKFVTQLQIKTTGVDHIVEYLSGGNQQKVVIAKWLATDARLLIFDEPTRGIDVGARRELYSLMDELASEGAAIVMISSDLPEILGMSDRIYVMHEGTICAEYSHDEASEENIMRSAVGR